MPGVKNTQKRISKKAVAAKRDNDKTIAALMSGDSHFVLGRVEKNFGSGGFQVRIDDPVGYVTGMPLGKFTRSTMPIAADSYVILEPSANGRAKVLEIVGVLSRKDAQTLYKQNRMSKVVWKTMEEKDEEEDDLFDYGDDDKVGGEGDVKEDKFGKQVENDSDEVDIDAI